MATVTIPEEITAMLIAQWGLVAPISTAEIHFDVGWVDMKQLRATNINAQVITSGPIASPTRFFGPNVNLLTGAVDVGLRLLNYHRYVINIWVPIPRGDLRGIWEDYAEQIRFEVIRIINEQRSAFVCLKIMFAIPLDAGIARHELDATPMILRYEITIQVDHMS